MLKLMILSLFTNLLASIGFAKASFESDFDFLSFTIKDTYAGYRDKVKGNEFDLLVKQVKRTHSKDTFALLSQLTTFFRDHHVFLYDDGISKQKIDTQQCKNDSQMLHRYFNNRKLKDKYEGYWLSDYDYCVIALKKVKSNPVTYYGYVMESKAKVIPGYCSIKMTQQRDGTFYTDYIGENLGFRAFFYSRFKNNNILWLNSFGGKWRRIAHYRTGLLANKTTFSFKPNFVKIDTNTVLLKMPDFGTQNKRRLDSIIKTNAKLIEQANTLIIDIRNNGGGYINSYLPLLPYIYTQPIVHSGGYTLISNNFMKQYDDKIKKLIANGDTINANIYMNYRDTFLAKRGQFDYNEGDTLVKDLPTLTKPKNIAVIINNNCLSAAELMLLNFKQSRKVTLFGERTGGAVDYLNAMTFKLPFGGYHLSVASVKRKFTDREPSYDKSGIPPDVEIDDDVPDWVAFVKKYYDEHK